MLLDKLLADPLFGPRIDREHIGAAGFSLGGYTVISVAGGQFSPARFESFCRSPQRDFTCEPQPEFPDARKLFAEIKNAKPRGQVHQQVAQEAFEFFEQGWKEK